MCSLFPPSFRPRHNISPIPRACAITSHGFSLDLSLSRVLERGHRDARTRQRKALLPKNCVFSCGLFRRSPAPTSPPIANLIRLAYRCRCSRVAHNFRSRKLSPSPIATPKSSIQNLPREDSIFCFLFPKWHSVILEIDSRKVSFVGILGTI